MIDYAAGVMFDRRTGDEVRAGDVKAGGLPTRAIVAGHSIPRMGPTPVVIAVYAMVIVIGVRLAATHPHPAVAQGAAAA